MALSLYLQVLLSSATELTIREALSGICGSISIANWTVVLIPQLIENFKNGSADGISTAFLLSWLLGDTCNLIGAIWTGLLPMVIALAMYFCITDCVLMGQVIYYKKLTNLFKRRKIQPDTSEHTNCPTQPLLNCRNSTNNKTNGRKSSASQHIDGRRNSTSSSCMLEKESATTAARFQKLIAILGTIFVGTVGWFIAYKSGAWSAKSRPSQNATPLGAQVLGYISAVLYLGARIPQIYQNYRKQSCEGLSILFFMLSLLGNLTYGAGILFHSTEASYVWANLPWLIGSLGTMTEDVVIFCQFHMYRSQTGIETSTDV